MGADSVKFTVQFKEAAVGEVWIGGHWKPRWRGPARSIQNVLTAGGGNFRTMERRPSWATASAGRRKVVSELERKVGRRWCWRSIFCVVACSMVEEQRGSCRH